MESGAKRIRLFDSDPEPTDSSSDEHHKRSKKKVHKIDLTLEKKESTYFPMGTRFDSSGEKIVGVRLRKSGKYYAEIRDPILKKGVHVGCFLTLEEAWEAYKAKRREMQEKVIRAKQEVNSPIEVSSVENEIPENRFGYLFGVQIVDENGFLLGDFSKIDDMRVPVTEDGAICQG